MLNGFFKNFFFVREFIPVILDSLKNINNKMYTFIHYFGYLISDKLKNGSLVTKIVSEIHFLLHLN